jgi:hypothetical protein
MIAPATTRNAIDNGFTSTALSRVRPSSPASAPATV